VLLLLDEPLVAEVVRLTLNHGVFVTRDANSVAGAASLAREWEPHLAIVDMEVGGAKFLEDLGARTASGTGLPVVGLTRRGDLPAKFAALDQGVDGILSVPFSPEELLARVWVITRRTYGLTPPLQPALRLGDIELDILHRHVRVAGEEIHLTGLELGLLYLLVANVGQVITRDQILDTLWGTDYLGTSTVVDQHIRNLRAKLQNNWRKPRFIATVPGVGYRFVPTASTDLRS
jgi:DNA-binding response OmpR family regulator